MKKILLLKFLVLFSIIGFSQDEPLIPDYIPTEGLVGWWPFNGNADDESSNGNFGTVNRAKLCDDRFNKKDHRQSAKENIYR